MAGIDDKREQEHKQRVKKLKAKTSKMRLAAVTEKKWSATGLSPKDAEKHSAEMVRKQEYLKLDPKTNKNKINNIHEAVIKKKNERKLSSGFTVGETYNISGQQQPDILQQADVSPYTPNRYEEIPKGKNKRKIRKEIIRNDNANRDEAREKKLY